MVYRSPVSSHSFQKRVSRVAFRASRRLPVLGRGPSRREQCSASRGAPPPRLPPQLVHSPPLGDKDVGLRLQVLRRRVAEKHIINVQHLACDVPADGGGTGKIRVLPGGDPLVPIGVQHAGAGDIRVTQHPILQLGEIHPLGGDAEIVGQRRGHQRRFLLRGKGRGQRAAGPASRRRSTFRRVDAVAGTPSAVYSTATGAAPTTAIL